MTLTDAEHLAVLLAAVTFLAIVGMSGVAVVRLRRRWRRRRSLRALDLTRLPLSAPVARVTGVVVSSIGSPSWWLVQRDRHSMWRAVSSARRAVSVAAGAGAPLGDLPGLTRQLERAARGVDAALRAGGRDPRLGRDAAADRARVENAAADIRAAAVSCLQVTQPEVQPVVSAIAVEVAALAAGVRSARSLRVPAR